jgi:recombinational DNA repair protein (RecF pathway)
MSNTYRDSGIVLRKYDLGEADVLLTMFLQRSGMVRMVAKGARRQSSRKRGHIELFNHVEGMVAEGRNLDVLTEVYALDTFDQWRSQLISVSLAYYAADITMLLLPERESHPVVFDTLLHYFSWLGRAADSHVLTRWYEVQLLQQLGYWSPDRLESQSANAIHILGRFGAVDARQAANVRVTPPLRDELERMMNSQLGQILEADSATKRFLDRVRDMEEEQASL